MACAPSGCVESRSSFCERGRPGRAWAVRFSRRDAHTRRFRVPPPRGSWPDSRVSARAKGAAAAQSAKRFAQGAIGIGKMQDAETYHDHIEARVGERKIASVPLAEADVRMKRRGFSNHRG